MSKIILLSGKAGSGKDTFYEIARKHFTCQRFAFADGVKDIAYDMCWDGKKDEKGRTLLQFIGDYARQYKPNIWIDRLLEDIQFSSAPRKIVTDCRYPNEIEKIKEVFGNNNVISVRIFGRQMDVTEEQSQHASETALDNYQFDYMLPNVGTIEEFELQVVRFFVDKVLGVNLFDSSVK